MKRIFILVALLLFGFIFYEDAAAWNDSVTHMDLSRYAGESSVLGKDDYLKNLGFSNGLLETFEWSGSTTIKKGSVKAWLAEGALLEDSGSYWEAVFNNARYNNHFHNPLKPWSSAGLTDLVPFSTESALIWAQDGAYQSSFPEGDWSWQKIRDYYHLALTSTTDTERQAYFAQTFKGLGHQLHIIEDMAQPDHVRNDSHIVDSLLEKNLSIFGDVVSI